MHIMPETEVEPTEEIQDIEQDQEMALHILLEVAKDIIIIREPRLVQEAEILRIPQEEVIIIHIILDPEALLTEIEVVQEQEVDTEHLVLAHVLEVLLREETTHLDLAEALRIREEVHLREAEVLLTLEEDHHALAATLDQEAEVVEAEVAVVEVAEEDKQKSFNKKNNTCSINLDLIFRILV